jgi:hypothetical protein
LEYVGFRAGLALLHAPVIARLGLYSEVKEMVVDSCRRARLSQLAEAGLEDADGGDGGGFGS